MRRSIKLKRKMARKQERRLRMKWACYIKSVVDSEKSRALFLRGWMKGIAADIAQMVLKERS